MEGGVRDLSDINAAETRYDGSYKCAVGGQRRDWEPLRANKRAVPGGDASLSGSISEGTGIDPGVVVALSAVAIHQRVLAS